MRERRKRRIYQAFSFAIHRKVWWLCVLDIMILMGRELWCSSSVSLWCVLCCVCVSPSSRRQSESERVTDWALATVSHQLFNIYVRAQCRRLYS